LRFKKLPENIRLLILSLYFWSKIYKFQFLLLIQIPAYITTALSFFLIDFLDLSLYRICSKNFIPVVIYAVTCNFFSNFREKIELFLKKNKNIFFKLNFFKQKKFFKKFGNNIEMTLTPAPEILHKFLHNCIKCA
jgi:hypothetical protein